MFSRYIKILRFVFYPLYLLSFGVPRSKSIWLFGAHQNRFAENSKALFQYISEQESSITPVWITGDYTLCHKLREDGYRAYIRWSLRGLFYSLRGKYYFYNLYSDDINYYTSGRAIMINLWHGIPLKKIEFDIKQGAQSRMFNSIYSPIYRFFKPYIFRNPDFVLSTSEMVSQLFSSAFRVTKEQCLELGYPRCDLFFNKNVPQEHTLKKLLDTETRHIYIYMPTWRNKNVNFINDAFPNFQKLNTTLQQMDAVMYVKLHPNTATPHLTFSNITFLDSRIDIYSLLPYTHTLITDYSSIYFDYLLLDKNIIFYPFDFQDYLNDDREFYFNYEEFTPGAKAFNFHDFLETLKNSTHSVKNSDQKVLKQRLWKYQDGNASKRIYDYFIKEV